MLRAAMLVLSVLAATSITASAGAGTPTYAGIGKPAVMINPTLEVGPNGWREVNKASFTANRQYSRRARVLLTVTTSDDLIRFFEVSSAYGCQQEAERILGIDPSTRVNCLPIDAQTY